VKQTFLSLLRTDAITAQWAGLGGISASSPRSQRALPTMTVAICSIARHCSCYTRNLSRQRRRRGQHDGRGIGCAEQGKSRGF
jgi:hypothetical protein